MATPRAARKFLVVANRFSDLEHFAERCNRLQRPAFLYRSTDLNRMLADLSQGPVQVCCTVVQNASTGWRLYLDNVDVIVLADTSRERLIQVQNRVHGAGTFYAPAANHVSPLSSRRNLCNGAP